MWKSLQLPVSERDGHGIGRRGEKPHRLLIAQLFLRRRNALLQRSDGQVRGLFAAVVGLLLFELALVLQHPPSEGDQQHRRHEQQHQEQQAPRRTRNRSSVHRSSFVVHCVSGSPARSGCSADPADWGRPHAARPQALPAACSRTGLRRPTRETGARRRCRRSCSSGGWRHGRTSSASTWR